MHKLLFLLLIASISSSTTDESKEIITICTNSLLSSLPPAFCWKKGADAGIIPKNCPKGFIRKAALCEEKCRPNYRFIAGLCYQNCKSGYKDHGLTCYSKFIKWYFKHSYIPKRLTNFDKRITCPGKMYHSGALCYRDCRIIGLQNCGIGTCAIDGKTCKDNVINMVVTVLTGGLNMLTKVFTMGGKKPFANIDTSLINTGIDKLGNEHMNNIFKHVKQVLATGKDYIHKEAYKKAQIAINQSRILRKLNFKAENACKPIFKALEKVNEYGETQPNGIVKSIDILKAIENQTDCKGKNHINCVKDSMSIFTNFDPTGLLTIAMAFMHPECVVPVE